MPEPASSSESTKQSGGISVTESRLSHSFLWSLSWLLGLFTGSTRDPKAFTEPDTFFLAALVDFLQAQNIFLLLDLSHDHHLFHFGSRRSPGTVFNIAEYKLS